MTLAKILKTVKEEGFVRIDGDLKLVKKIEKAAEKQGLNIVVTEMYRGLYEVAIEIY